jgi:RNA-directed DNA polymerase
MWQNNQLELNLGSGASGEAARAAAQETEARAAKAEIEGRAVALGPSMEAVVERANLEKALAQVKRNKGSPGIDGMSVDDLAGHLKAHWPTLREQLLAGTYRPRPVRRVERALDLAKEHGLRSEVKTPAGSADLAGGGTYVPRS